MTNNDDSTQDGQRRRGRPRTSDSPTVPWHEVDNLLVFGEPVADGSPESGTIRYPTYRELANRYGVSMSLIGNYAKSRQCTQRRRDAQAREQVLYEQQFAEKRAEARAIADVNAIELIDEYVARFYVALQQGRVRTDSVTDFNTMMRLREFLAGRADSRQEVQTTITLEEIQERHAALRAQLATLDPAITGEEVPPALPAEANADDADRRVEATYEDEEDWDEDEDEPPPRPRPRQQGGLRVIGTRVGRGWEDEN